MSPAAAASAVSSDWASVPARSLTAMVCVRSARPRSVSKPSASASTSAIERPAVPSPAIAAALTVWPKDSVCVAAVAPNGPPALAGTSNSAGRSRSISPGSIESATSASQHSPLARTIQARPIRGSLGPVPRDRRAGARASRVRSSRSGNKLASVRVPGVTIRTTLRSTGPLLVAGSPICSHTATDSPRRIKRARCCSSDWTGTPAIGMGSPALTPRRVRVMPSRGAARSASP